VREVNDPLGRSAGANRCPRWCASEPQHAFATATFVAGRPRAQRRLVAKKGHAHASCNDNTQTFREPAVPATTGKPSEWIKDSAGRHHLRAAEKRLILDFSRTTSLFSFSSLAGGACLRKRYEERLVEEVLVVARALPLEFALLGRGRRGRPSRGRLANFRAVGAIGPGERRAHVLLSSATESSRISREGNG